MNEVVDLKYTRDVRELPPRELPVLDLKDFLSGDEAAKPKLAAQLREVAENLGFCCVINHGIPQELIERMEEQARRFHAQPMEEKLKIKVNDHQRGYIPPRATLVKHSTYNKNTKLDLNATYVLATEYDDDHPGIKQGKQFYAKNQWPENLPGFRETANEYMETMTALGKKMLPLLALALEIDEDFFEPYFDDNYTYFRVAYYPPKPELETNEQGIGAHADTGVLTFLPPAKEEGLQVLGVDGKWFNPVVPEGAIVVNFGQFLERWTNGRFRATPHRVIPPVKNERFTIPVFVNPNFHSQCETIPTCTGPDNPPKYPKESYWDFFRWYMHNSYPHYREFDKKNNSAA